MENMHNILRNYSFTSEVKILIMKDNVTITKEKMINRMIINQLLGLINWLIKISDCAQRQ